MIRCTAIAAMASGGFDSPPHCGPVIAMLTITQLTHRGAYTDIGVVTVVIPLIATRSAIGIALVMKSGWGDAK